MITPYPFYSNFDDTYKYLFNSSVRLAEQFVTVGSVTLRFSVHVFVYECMYVCMQGVGKGCSGGAIASLDFEGCACITYIGDL